MPPIMTLDQIAPQRRLNLILPPGIARAKQNYKNERQVGDAKLATTGLWVGGRFSLASREVNRLFFHVFALKEHEIDAALRRAFDDGWIDVVATAHGLAFDVRMLPAAFSVPCGSTQKCLPLGPPHHDLAIDRVVVECRHLRLLFPQRVMYHQNLHSSHKMVFLYIRITNWLAESVTINYNAAANYFGLDRATIRNAVSNLSEKLELPFTKEYGGARLHAAHDRLYLPWETDKIHVRVSNHRRRVRSHGRRRASCAQA